VISNLDVFILLTCQPVNLSTYIIEIATTDYTTTKNAVEGGADRIELCAALSDGGTTPTAATIKKCREDLRVELFPIIRPRGGDFFYTDEEFDIMLEEIKGCRELGCDGIVIGALKKDGTIPKKKIARLVEAAYPLEVTFHRAFDRCKDPFATMEELIQLGCQRILTSGQKPSAIDGADLIAELIKKADGRIIIMPGSGVRKGNIKELAKTGATEFHSSLRGKINSEMNYRNADFPESDYQNNFIDPEEVRALRAALASTA
jgi:copper homeostasis protein